MCCVRRQLANIGVSKESAEVIAKSWRPGTIKQYQLAWKRYFLWCHKRKKDPFHPSETLILDYINNLRLSGVSYSVLNTAKSMLSQTLNLFGVNFDNFRLLSRLMTGCFNLKPPRARYNFTWDVGVVLRFLSSLYPLEDLSLKLLTFKLVTLVALITAARAQTLSALDLDYLSYNSEKSVFVFQIHDILKTTRPGNSLPNIVLKQYDKPELCVIRTLKRYIVSTKKLRKSNYLFVSYKTYCKVTTSTLARWLRIVLTMSGVDVSKFKAHSFRGASTTAALSAGCSLKDILSTANWASAETFKKFYHKQVSNSDVENNFANSVLSYV